MFNYDNDNDGEGYEPIDAPSQQSDDLDEAPPLRAKESRRRITSPPSSNQRQTAIKAIRNMDVHLDFSLGQVTIPLSRLEKLSPHQVLEDLKTVSFPRVQILMGGKPFAEGSLVDVKGNVGCKILRFLS